MEDTEIRKRFFVYTVLTNFTQSLFFAFGALLIYSKTHSIEGVLLYNLARDFSSVFTKSVGFGFVAKRMKSWGFVPAMSVGMAMNALAYFVIFLLDPGAHNFYVLLLPVAVIGSIGSSVHSICGNALMFEVIGTSKVPGFSAAQIDALQILSGLVAVLVGTILNRHGLFNYSFVFGSFMLFASMLPLWGISKPAIKSFSFWENFKTIPRPMLLANFNPDHEIKVTALPLVILAFSASLKFSINVSGLIAVLSIVFAYLAGWLKDKGSNSLVWLAFLLSVGSWVSYVFVRTPLGFVLPSVVISFAMGVLTLYREARMSVYMKSSESFLANTFIVEFMRSLGTFSATILIFLVYVLFKHIPKDFLAVSWIFLIPLAIYGYGKDKDVNSTIVSSGHN